MTYRYFVCFTPYGGPGYQVGNSSRTIVERTHPILTDDDLADTEEAIALSLKCKRVEIVNLTELRQ